MKEKVFSEKMFKLGDKTRKEECERQKRERKKLM